MNRKRVWLTAQALITTALLAVLLRSLDLQAFGALFVTLPAWFYALSLAVVLAGQVVYAWRWRLLLAAAGVRAPFSVVIRQYFIGIFLNNFFPSTVGGDLAKVYLLGRDHGYRAVTASVLLDRMLGLGLLAVCAAVTLWAVPMPSAVLAGARLAVTGIAAGALVVLALAAAGTGGLSARVSWMGPRVAVLAERLQRLRLDMAAALTSPLLIAQAAAAVIGYFIAVAAVYVLFIRMHAVVAPSFALVMGVVMTTSVLSNIPISLNGLGLREQLHAVLLAPLGVPREAAVAISLLLFGHLLVASALGLAFWMQSGALRPDTAARLEL